MARLTTKINKTGTFIIVCIISLISLIVLMYRSNDAENNSDLDTYSNAKYDYIVIGSATGSIVATRLAQAGNRVLLIESGPDDLTFSCTKCNAKPNGDLIKGFTQIPFSTDFFRDVAALRWDAHLMPSFWNYAGTQLDKRRAVLHRAKMLGGCLSHNSHQWSRGSIRDYDFVAKECNLPDWSFRNILPIFSKLETYFGENKTARGSNGPIEIIQNKPQSFEYSLQALLHTAVNYGLPYNNHQAGKGSQYGIGYGESNIGKYKDGKRGMFNTEWFRESSANMFVRNIGLAQYSQYLTVWYDTTVQKVIIKKSKKNSGYKAVGVRYWDSSKKDTLQSVYCSKDVIVSGGAYQSPQLLILSGIGPLQQLRKFNISSTFHHKSHEKVGQFGQDHTHFMPFSYKVNLEELYKLNGVDKNTRNKPNGSFFDMKVLTPHLQTDYRMDKVYLNYNKGRIDIFLSSGIFDRLGTDYNDIRIWCYENNPVNDVISCSIDSNVYSKNLTVELNGLDSRKYPSVYANYFKDSRDYDMILYGIEEMRKIFAHNSSIFKREIFPGLRHNGDRLKQIIHLQSRPSGHAVGTVSMGSTNDYPVDERCRVRGVHGLRVVDASIWPYLRNSGAASLVFAIGEKCSKYIVEDHSKVLEGAILNSGLFGYALLVCVIGFIVYKLQGNCYTRGWMSLSVLRRFRSSYTEGNVTKWN